MTRLLFSTAVLFVLATALPGRVEAQPLGTFRWQLQPFCNVVTVAVTQNGGVYRLEGTDNGCGATQASVIGTAFLNPDGSVGIGLNVVAAPGGQPFPVSATLSLATLAGTWRDEGGNSGAFVPTAGGGTGGSPRPLPIPVVLIPPAFRLQTDGGFLARSSLGVGTIPAAGAGLRMMWHPAKAAFRAGNVTTTQWDEANVGSESAAFNKNTTASGVFSFAVNDSTTANGQASFATGFFSTASGNVATAMGSQTVASGPASFAAGSGTNAIGTRSVALGLNTSATGAHALSMGDGTIASGGNSFAIGATSQANGAESVAMGLRVLAGGNGSVVLGSDAVTQAAATGSFIFADRSTTTDIVSFAPNEFIVRAAGGIGLYTNAGLTAGVEMAAGGSSWLVVSDVNMKEHFRDLAGEDVLSRIAAMPVKEWNYKSQDASIRHVGPTAQDFHAAFGLGENPLRINTIDADGIALAAVRALEARTRELRDDNARLQRANDELTERLERLERKFKQQ
jgi:Chaperone of endosialidase/Head domain of trimeric autotransporter adhesin